MSTSEDRTSGASGMAEQQAAGLLGGELRDGYAELGDQRLHYVEAGQGPLIVLLHGFPEFWYGWRLQLKPLTAAGFRVVAPDLRGYNLSSRPGGVEAYDTLWLKSAALLDSIVRTRPLAEGNWRLGWVAAVTMCDMNGWWIDADEEEALEIVREVGRGNVDVPKMAGHLEAWGLPKESDL